MIPFIVVAVLFLVMKLTTESDPKSFCLELIVYQCTCPQTNSFLLSLISSLAIHIQTRKDPICFKKSFSLSCLSYSKFALLNTTDLFLSRTFCLFFRGKICLFLSLCHPYFWRMFCKFRLIDSIYFL